MLQEKETVMTWQRNRNFKEFATNVPGRLFTCAPKRERSVHIELQLDAWKVLSSEGVQD